MTVNHKEIAFESAIEDHLLTSGGYTKDDPANFDRDTAKIDILINKVTESIEKLREYRTALISATVTGKIDVREEDSQ